MFLLVIYFVFINCLLLFCCGCGCGCKQDGSVIRGVTGVLLTFQKTDPRDVEDNNCKTRIQNPQEQVVYHFDGVFSLEGVRCQ